MDLHLPPLPSSSSSASASPFRRFPDELDPCSKWWHCCFCTLSSSSSSASSTSSYNRFSLSSHLRRLLRRLKSSVAKLNYFKKVQGESFLYDSRSYAMNFEEEGTCFHRRTFCKGSEEDCGKVLAMEETDLVVDGWMDWGSIIQQGNNEED